MAATLEPNGNIKAVCPDCGTHSQFVRSRKELVKVRRQKTTREGPMAYGTEFWLCKCSACDRGGYAELSFKAVWVEGGPPPTYTLDEFAPLAIEERELPKATPPPIMAEYREAERCAAFGCPRGAAALARSALEKTLIANGYKSDKKGLQRRLAVAGEEGIVTKVHVELADKHARVLGNDVLHGPWRKVAAAEVVKALEYVMWIMRDFYEAREMVVDILRKRKRSPQEG